MEIDIQTLVRRTDPKNTVLFFGAGSSIPSGAPSAPDLVQGLSNKFHVEGSESLDLKLISAIIEMQYGRDKLIGYLRSVLQKLNPQKGILNVPDFDWASIFTTNYDELIEKSFKQRRKSLEVYDSNFSFSSREDINAQKLFKLHGSITHDIIDGHNSRIIISATDYDNTQDYRELLFANLKEQLLSKDIIIIGYSLGDQYLRETLEFALEAKKNRGAMGSMTLLIYEKNAGLSALYSQRGFDVCFGGIDDFFLNLTNVAPSNQLSFALSDDPLDRARRVLPCTLTVSTQRVNQQANLAALFNGRAASYADIMRGWSFNREFSIKLEQQLTTESALIALILGPAGSGKTSGVRQALNRLVDRDIFCWEHVDDHALPWRDWVEIDKELKKRQKFGVLFIDNAHEHLSSVNSLIDALPKNGSNRLRIVVSSSKPQWNHRVKSSSFFTNCESYEIGSLAESEIDSLLLLLDNQSEVSELVERRFLGFSRAERKRRLVRRCSSDMFVCMKNIFGMDAFDNIILREFNELSEDYQDIYRRVAGMEAAGIRVHRQLVLRTIGISANNVERYLEDLDGIITEYTVNEKLGVFGWKVRHGVIASIVADYKIANEDEYYQLINNTIDNLNPSYRIETLSINDICDYSKGLGKISNKDRQNILLRKLISLAPRERVPRHRLITNLIAQGDYDTANAEIRMFENEFNVDGPVQRYKVRLAMERAQNSEGLTSEDKSQILRHAENLAQEGVRKFSNDTNLIKVYLDLGILFYHTVGATDIFDQAMTSANAVYKRLLDPDLMRTINHYQQIGERFKLSI